MRTFCFLAIILVCISLTKSGLAETCGGKDDNNFFFDVKALQPIQSLANAGDSHAQAQLGLAYLRGLGVDRNTLKALSLLEKSAKGGDRDGQYLLGKYYGITGKINSEFKQSAHWLKKSADQGCLPALFYLGGMTTKGKGVKKNVDVGVQMITRAAEGGYAPAQLWLSTFFLTGDGVRKNTKTGFEWMKRAADTGDSAAEIGLASLYMQGKGTEQDSEAARSLLTSVYAKNDAQASAAAFSLGWMYMEGEGVPVNNVEAFRWMIVAANANISDSARRVKTLTDLLPNKDLVTDCGVYMDPLLAANGAKEYLHVEAGETVACLNNLASSSEVYFPNRHLLGYISPQCLDTKNITDKEE